MKVERSNLSQTRVKLVVSADEADLSPIKNHVLAHFRHLAKVPGFRAGTAPMSLVEKHVDQKQLIDEFMEHALNTIYRQAVEQEGLKPAGNPQVQLKKIVPFSLLEFESETDVIGKISLPEYQKIKLKKDQPKVSDQDIVEVLESLRVRQAKRKPLKRPAKKGDEVVIDFKGTDKNGQPVSGADGKDFPLILGSAQFIPGFEEQLIGAKSGQKTKFTVKFPKDYGVAALQNKDVLFAVEVKAVNDLELPKLDDIFATQAGPFKSLAELKSDIKKQLQLEAEQQAERNLANRVVAEIVSKSSIDIPDGLIDDEISRLEDEEKRNLMYRGQTWEEHLKEEGLTEQQHRQRQKPRAEERLRGGLVLGEIAEREKIVVSKDELDQHIKLLKGQYQDAAMQAELDKPQARGEIENRLLTEKTIQKLVEYAAS